MKTAMRPGAIVLLLAMLSLAGGACMSYTRQEPAAANRGLNFDHALHAAQGLECSICHEPAEDGKAMSRPGHDTCSVCHDVPEDPLAAIAAAEEGGEPEKTCAVCHSREDYSVEKPAARLSGEIVFAHGPHVQKEVACASCHGEPVDKQPMAVQASMTFCMDCHGKTDPKLNACAVCHSEVGRDIRPTQWKGRHVSHDMPEIWTRVHGRESAADPAFCALCHDVPNDCETCHQKTAPDDHTVSWRRKLHGMKAAWDRNRCAACHEEDSCRKCHEHNEPSSHRAGWGSPVNRHCVECHYPPTQTGCVACHDKVDHERAMPSPHSLALYPPKCNRCHPGGLPNRAPHLMNSSTRCAYCHQ